MKTLKMITVSLMSILALNGFAKTTVPYAKEKLDIRRNLSSITADRNTIQSLKEKVREDKQADKRVSVIIDKKELAKARADLRRDKAYLCANKTDLRRDHKEAIKTRRALVRQDRSGLSSARWERFKNRYIFANEAAAQQNEIAIADYKRALDDHRLGLRDERMFKNLDMIAVNKEIREYNGQFKPFLTSEIAYERTENWFIEK